MSKSIKELLPLGVTLLGIGYLAFNWSALPELVPMHFGLLGQPDGWAPKPVALFLPFIALFLYGNLTFAEKSNRFNMPWKITEQNRDVLFSMARNLMFTLKLELSALIAYLQIAVVETALKHMDGLGPWFAPVFLGSIFITIGLFFVQGTSVVRQQEKLL
ncbi:DUF1648 domain-containing protein [bacterium]|nr:DUF1648 domain-containing protein [bacterium]MBP9806779.1 DUF1648 domain-containing protein [bacterium]